MSDHLLPPSATELLRQLSQSAGRATELQVAIRDAWSPDRCPSHMLPWLAWAVGVEEWDVRWTDAQKRAAIASSLTVKRTKGTIGAVTAAVESLGLGVQVIEWFNQVPAGEPYTFDLVIAADQAGAGGSQHRPRLRGRRDAPRLRPRRRSCFSPARREASPPPSKPTVQAAAPPAKGAL